MTEDLRVGGLVSQGWWWSTITPNRCSVRQCAATQHLKMLPSLLVEPATEPGALHPAKECRGGAVFRCSPPPPVVVGGEGADDNPVGVVVEQAGAGGMVMLVDGFVAP